jgi:hypothetical protein
MALHGPFYVSFACPRFERQTAIQSIEFKEVAVLSVRGTRTCIPGLARCIAAKRANGTIFLQRPCFGGDVVENPVVIHSVGAHKGRNVGVIHDEDEGNCLRRDIVKFQGRGKVFSFARVAGGDYTPFPEDRARDAHIVP